MEFFYVILDYYNQNKLLFVIVAFVILALLLFRFKSVFFRLFLIGLLLLGTYVFIAHFAGIATTYKKALIDRYFPRERLK